MPWLILSAFCFTLGGLCMKASAGLTRLYPSLMMAALFVCGAALQAVVMRQEDMSVAYISVLGFEAVLAFAGGTLVFAEPVSALRLCSVVLIVTGVWLLHR